MKKIYTVTGPKGCGKSTAVAQFLPPSQIHRAIIVDTEDSMSDIKEEMERLGIGFGSYIRMYDRLSKSQRESVTDAIAKGELPWIDTGVKQSALVGYYEYFIKEMARILKKNKDKGDKSFIYLGIDTIEPIEAGLSAWVDTHKKQAGWSGQTAYGKKEVEGVRPLYEGVLEGYSLDGILSFCLSSHIKPVWREFGKDNRGKTIVRQVPNKVKTGGRVALLSRLSSQMWWLVPDVGNEDGAPAGLRLKARRGNITIDIEGDSWVNRKVLPRRVPHFTWADVREYDKNPANLVNPPDNEVPTKQELEMISEFLSTEQMKLMVLGAERALEEARGYNNGGGGSVQSAQPSASTFSLPTPEYRTAKGKADELLAQGLAVNETELLNAFIPPRQAAIEVKDAIRKVLGEV